MLALTDTATEAIEGILNGSNIPDGAGVRIATASGESEGTGSADLSITLAESPAQGDQVIDEQGARVFVEALVADYLDDKLLDARISEQQVSFVLGEQPAGA